MGTKITLAIDGGALTQDRNKQFGNYVFTQGLLTAIDAYDQDHDYTLYLQEPYPELWHLHHRLLRPKWGWLKLNLSFQELINRHQVFLALNQALPCYTAGQKIVFCHGLAPIMFPKLYPDSYRQFEQQISLMVKQANWIVVGSVRLQKQLVDLYGKKISHKIKVLNYGLSHDFVKTTARFKKKRLLLYVGSNHPIKNLPFLFKSFARFCQLKTDLNYKLVLVGVGKACQIPRHLNHRVIVVDHLDHRQLQKFYGEAECLLTASLEESFNLPVLEALSQNTQVVGTKTAIIPELLPFVFTAKPNPQNFAQTILDTINSPKTINLMSLRKQFNWQNYVQQLVKLYGQN